MDSKDKINHKTMDHVKIDHGAMNHNKMNHENMDHSSMQHENMDHSSMSHEGMDHSSMQHEGMDHSKMGHGGPEVFKKKFFICLFLAIPVLFLSPMMGVTLPFQFTFQGSNWVVLILSSILYFYGGMPFLKGAKQELSQKAPAMMTLISLGISSAYFYSLYAFVINTFITKTHSVMDFFWELATLIVIMLLGHWVEMKAVAGAGDALKKMAELLPNKASVQQADGGFLEVELTSVTVGQKVMVKAGEKVPADGTILEGHTAINESMVTGEAKDVSKQVGDSVIGGSVNGAGSILVEVTGTGETGYLAQVMQLVNSAQQEKSKAETLSDKVARLLFYAAVIVGVLALIIWFIITKSFDTALTRMVTVLVIACPHALGLAIPLVTARSTSLGAKNGLLVRDRKALEAAKHIDVIMMDKTGTLTEGNFKVTNISVLDNNYTEDEILAVLGALEAGSSHPLATGILKEVAERKVVPAKATEIQNLPGIGLAGTLGNGKKAEIVSASYLDKQNANYDKSLFLELAAKGYSVSYLLIDELPVGLIALGDEIKPDSKRMIEELKKQGITPMMLTGDNQASAEAVARQLGIEDFRAGLLPEDKEKIVVEFKNRGKKVMMVGDGVNDAPSLSRADIGVAIGAGTDVAIESADVILVKSNPSDILHFISLAKNTNRKMVQNLWWGAGYNVVAIPLAAGVLAGVGFVLSPAAGAVLMSLSTVIVAINAMTLKIK